MCTHNATRKNSIIASYSYNHCIAKNLNKFLMHETHIPCPKKTNRSWPLLLNGQQLLHKKAEKRINIELYVENIFQVHVKLAEMRKLGVVANLGTVGCLLPYRKHSHSQILYFLSLRHLIALISFHAMGKSVDLDGHSFLIGIIEFKVKSKWTCMFTQTCTHERERERERELQHCQWCVTLRGSQQVKTNT